MLRIARLYLILFSFGMFMMPTNSKAQSIDIKGVVLDENQHPLGYTSIVLLALPDSSTVQFTLSELSGSFVFKSVPEGAYVIQALYSGYEIYEYGFKHDGLQEFILPKFELIPASTTLKQALIVAKKIPMVFKGDTIVYNPSAFTTKTTATVEDLLKKLPGVQVGKDGSVTAQGEKVVKVLVNGKEFFGDDPTKATQNINADAVDKVEILEKKSEKSDFTGVDDGTREKVINLVLKEDASKGYFGKIEAGGGTEETYKLKATLNYFNKENQFTLIGNLNNLNQNGFSWSEYYRMLNGNNGVNLGQNTYWFNQNDWLGANEQGRQQNAVLGTNGHFKVGKGEVDFSYFLMDRSNELKSTTTSENYLPSRTIFGDSRYDADKDNGQHKMLGHYKLNPDTLNFFEIHGQVDLKNGSGFTNGFFSNATEEGSLLNNTLSQTSLVQQNLNYKGKVVYMKKFKNNRHSLHFESGAERNEGFDTTQWANFVSNSSLNYTEVLPYQFADQIYGSGNVIYNMAGFQYHLGKKLFLGLEGQNKFSKDTYEQNRANLDTDSMLTAQSPTINTTHLISKGSVRLIHNSGREGWYLNAVLGLAHIALERNLALAAGDQYQNSLLFFTPSFYAGYRKPREGRIGIWLNATENLSNISQINPVGDVSNPMRLNSGNFELDPTMSYNIGTHFSKRNASRNRFIFGRIQAGLTPNAVTIKETRDTNNFGTSTFVNFKETRYFNPSIEYQIPVEKLKMEIGNSLSFNHYDYYSILNEVSYLNTRNTFGFGIDLEFQLDPVEFDIAYNPEYSIQNSPLMANAVTFWKHDISTEVHVEISKRISGYVDYSVFYYSSRQIAQQQLVPILNAGIDWRLDSLQKWTISLTGYDMLKKAQLINRNFFGNAFSETRQNTITRFFMFSLSYSIKKGKKKEEPRGLDWHG